MLVVAFALTLAQQVEECSTTEEVCLLQLRHNTSLGAGAEETHAAEEDSKSEEEARRTSG